MILSVSSGGVDSPLENGLYEKERPVENFATRSATQLLTGTGAEKARLLLSSPSIFQMLPSLALEIVPPVGYVC